jgi:hypothetical protein
MLIVLLHIFKCSIEFCLHTSSNAFPIISPRHVLCHHSTHLWTTQLFLFFICFFSCWISCWCNSFNPHSFLFLPRPFPISVPLIHWQTDTYMRLASSQQNNSSVGTLKLSTNYARYVIESQTGRKHPACHPLVPSVLCLTVLPSICLYTPNYLLVNV